jgi:hypothetical protein
MKKSLKKRRLKKRKYSSAEKKQMKLERIFRNRKKDQEKGRAMEESEREKADRKAVIDWIGHESPEASRQMVIADHLADHLNQETQLFYVIGDHILPLTWLKTPEEQDAFIEKFMTWYKANLKAGPMDKLNPWLGRADKPRPKPKPWQKPKPKLRPEVKIYPKFQSRDKSKNMSQGFVWRKGFVLTRKSF